MLKRDFNKISFISVGMGLIIFGAIVFAVAFTEWILVSCGFNGVIAYPFFKAISGVMILGLGYMIVELELLRIK